MGSWWRRMCSYLRQEPGPVPQAELDAAREVLSTDPDNDYRGETVRSTGTGWPEECRSDWP